MTSPSPSLSSLTSPRSVMSASASPSLLVTSSASPSSASTSPTNSTSSASSVASFPASPPPLNFIQQVLANAHSKDDLAARLGEQLRALSNRSDPHSQHEPRSSAQDEPIHAVLSSPTAAAPLLVGVPPAPSDILESSAPSEGPPASPSSASSSELSDGDDGGGGAPSSSSGSALQAHRRGRWSASEDALLKRWVEHYDGKNWKRIAESAFGALKSDVQCLTGDHHVLTRSGWRSIRLLAVDDVVASLNISTLAIEWKKVLAVQSFAATTRGRYQLFRMEGAGMDVVATRGHRMLLARLNSAGLSTRQPFVYETVGQLTNLRYLAAGLSYHTHFEYSKVRSVLRSGRNLQPSVKLVIPGMKSVCDWWWRRDHQMGFLRFLGFWLRDGHLQVGRGHSEVCVSQRKPESTAWLIALLNEVFPCWWYRNAISSDANGTTYGYHIRCPPLFDWFRLLAVGPPGYNPMDLSALGSYPDFVPAPALPAGRRGAEQPPLVDVEAQSRYYRPSNPSTWTEAAMLAAMTASDATAERCWWCSQSERQKGEERLVCKGCQCGGHLQCFALQAKPAEGWLCPDCIDEAAAPAMMEVVVTAVNAPPVCVAVAGTTTAGVAQSSASSSSSASDQRRSAAHAMDDDDAFEEVDTAAATALDNNKDTRRPSLSTTQTLSSATSISRGRSSSNSSSSSISLTSASRARSMSATSDGDAEDADVRDVDDVDEKEEKDEKQDEPMELDDDEDSDDPGVLRSRPSSAFPGSSLGRRRVQTDAVDASLSPHPKTSQPTAAAQATAAAARPTAAMPAPAPAPFSRPPAPALPPAPGRQASPAVPLPPSVCAAEDEDDEDDAVNTSEESDVDDDNEEDVPSVEAIGDEDADERMGAALRARGRIVWWNNGKWFVLGSHWFYLKRWLGPNVAATFSHLSQQQAVALLEGFCRADGQWASIRFDESGAPEGHWRCSNSSFPLIHQLQLIGQLAGASSDLSLHSEAGSRTHRIDGREVRLNAHHWRLVFNFSHSTRAPVDIANLAKPVDVSANVVARGNYLYQDDGRVYDITVEHNGNFLTQRLAWNRVNTAAGGLGVRAKPLWVGNCLHRWQKVLKPGLIKGPWMKAEDDLVCQLVAKYGVKKCQPHADAPPMHRKGVRGWVEDSCGC